MNKLKFISILALVLLLTGCDATYRISIDDNRKVEENIQLRENYNLLLSISTTPSNYMQDQIDSLKKIEKYKPYSMKTYINNLFAYGEALRNYDNLNDYDNSSTMIDEIFSDASFEQNGDIVSLVFVPDKDFKYFTDAEEYKSLLDNLTIEIDLPYEVIENNADDVDGMIYKWHYSKGESLEKINLSFDLSKNLKNEMPLSIKIIIGSVSVLLMLGTYIFVMYKRNSK